MASGIFALIGVFITLYFNDKRESKLRLSEEKKLLYLNLIKSIHSLHKLIIKDDIRKFKDEEWTEVQRNNLSTEITKALDELSMQHDIVKIFGSKGVLNAIDAYLDELGERKNELKPKAEYITLDLIMSNIKNDLNKDNNFICDKLKCMWSCILKKLGIDNLA